MSPIASLTTTSSSSSCSSYREAFLTKVFRYYIDRKVAANSATFRLSLTNEVLQNLVVVDYFFFFASGMRPGYPVKFLLGAAAFAGALVAVH
jgi:hypothetical protein